MPWRETKAGARISTHLGNGCRMQMHRHDNIIQRALSLADRLWICFIADGAHIPFFALSNYLKVAGLARLGVKVAIVSRVGAEGHGDFVREWLEGEGVDVRTSRTTALTRRNRSSSSVHDGQPTRCPATAIAPPSCAPGSIA